MDEKRNHRGPDKKPRKKRTDRPETVERWRTQATAYKPGYSRPAQYPPEVYQSMILAAAAAYPDYFYPDMTPEEVRAELDDPQAFRGLLLYINAQVFKPGPDAPRKYGSNLDYSDTALLDFIFQQYLALCARHHQIPTIDNYLILTGIDNNTVNSWKNGKSRNYSNSNTSIYNSAIDIKIIDSDSNIADIGNSGIEYKQLNHRDLIGKWNQICKAALVDQAGRKNSIGSIFLLKAVHGFRDSSPVQLEVSTAGPRESAAAIAARHAGEEPPQLPDGDAEN